MAEDFGIWVYVVASAIHPAWCADLRGVGGSRVRTVAAGGLGAAVSQVALSEFGEQPLRRHLEDLAWLEATARVHHRVIEEIARHGPVVPMRLATIYRDEAGAARTLTERHAELAAALRRVEGRTEWGVKVYAAQTPAGGARGGVADSAGGQGGSGGRGAAYLRRRRTELAATEDARQAAVTGAQRVHTALAQLTAGAQLRPAQDRQLTGQAARMILNGAYLVDDDRSAEFRATVDALARQHHAVRIEMTGPWPPYSFATIAETAETDAAAARTAAAEREAAV